jgi:hypothetical protein
MHIAKRKIDDPCPYFQSIKHHISRLLINIELLEKHRMFTDDPWWTMFGALAVKEK